MANDLGLPSVWSGKMFQGFNRVIDWRGSVTVDFEKFGEGEGIKIAIIGSGLERHRDLNAVNGYNLSNGNPYSSEDANGHSTFISGIIAGNGKTFIKGIAPKAEVCAIKIFDKNETADFRLVETGLLWAKDNGASVVLIDAEIFNTIPFSIKRIVETLEENRVPVFINGKKNRKCDFTKYTTDFENNSCWLDDWYKRAENIDNALPIAVGLAALIKEKEPKATIDEIYLKIDAILFAKKKEERKKTKEIDQPVIEENTDGNT